MESASDVMAALRASEMSAYAFQLHHVIQSIVFHRPDTRHLFTSGERDVFTSLMGMSSKALGLYGRLLSRKGHCLESQ